MENKRYKILLIEDDKLDQMAFKRLVEKENLPYDYDIAASVSQAKSVLEQNQFDIIIVDYLLGDGTAFDIFDFITDTPAIFATGAGTEELAIKAMKSHAYDYLIKDPERNYLKVLPTVIKNAVNHKENERQLKKYHENLEILVRERAEQLATEKELLSITLSSMGDAVIAVDADKSINLFNKVAENLTGCKFIDIEGKNIDEILQIVDEQTKKPLANPVDRAIESGRIESGTDQDCLVAADGTLRPVAVTAAPIRKSDETMVGAVMVIRDVSREREIDRMKTNFVSSVSHELRTPLTSIKAYTATILRDPKMQKNIRNEFLKVIDEESDRLTKLIENLLEVSKIESGVAEIEKQNVDVSAVINQAIATLQPLADEKYIRLRYEPTNELMTLPADQTKISSVVTNLINNAIKFTPQYGQVAVEIERKGYELVIKVADNGVGIPKEALPRIFDRFYRVYRPGEQIQGTGLGLAIVKKIVSMHNGRIEVESKENEGSTFTVYLPIAAQQTAAVNS
jgi:PAS domain S-box-containing protein